MTCQPCEARQARLLDFANQHGTLLGLGLGLLLAIVWVPRIIDHQESHS